MDDLKVCVLCEDSFPRTKEHFYANKSTKDGLSPRCKKCWAVVRNPRPKVPEGHARCTKCEGIFPATKEHFNVNNSRHNGISYYCRKCTSLINNGGYVSTKAQGPKEAPPITLNCRVCGKEKPATPEFFPAQPTAKYGLRKSCKECEAPYHRQWMKSKKRKDWEKKHYKEHRVSYFRNRYQSQKETILEKQRVFRINNPEIVLGWKQKYAKSDRGHAAGRAKENRRRAKKLAVQGSFSSEQIQEQLIRQRYRCYYAACGHAKFQKKKGVHIYHIEHTFPISRVAGTDIPANSIDYLVLACPSCNVSKKDKFPWEWPEGGRLL